MALLHYENERRPSCMDRRWSIKKADRRLQSEAPACCNERAASCKWLNIVRHKAIASGFLSAISVRVTKGYERSKYRTDLCGWATLVCRRSDLVEHRVNLRCGQIDGEWGKSGSDQRPTSKFGACERWGEQSMPTVARASDCSNFHAKDGS